MAGADPFESTLDDEGGEMLAINLREHDEDVCEAAVRNPHLLPRQGEAAVGQANSARGRAERVRSGSRLAERIRAHRLAGYQARKVLGFLFGCTEVQDRADSKVACGAECGAERRAARRVAADDERGGFTEPDAAIFVGRVDTEQAQLASPSQQLTREGPVFLLEPVDGGDDLLFRKLARSLRDHAMLVSETLRRQHGRGIARLEQPCRALMCKCRCHATRSRMPAAPIPPPTHIVTSP